MRAVKKRAQPLELLCKSMRAGQAARALDEKSARGQRRRRSAKLRHLMFISTGVFATHLSSARAAATNGRAHARVPEMRLRQPRSMYCARARVHLIGTARRNPISDERARAHTSSIAQLNGCSGGDGSGGGNKQTNKRFRALVVIADAARKKRSFVRFNLDKTR